MEKIQQKGFYARVYGRVQGVGFRYSTINHARRIGVAGYTRNMPDGSVEVVAEGEVDKLKKLISWLNHGPPTSHVDRVDFHYTPYKGYYKSFSVEY